MASATCHWCCCDCYQPFHSLIPNMESYLDPLFNMGKGFTTRATPLKTSQYPSSPFSRSLHPYTSIREDSPDERVVCIASRKVYRIVCPMLVLMTLTFNVQTEISRSSNTACSPIKPGEQHYETLALPLH